MADSNTAPAFDGSLQQGEDHDAYLNRLLTSGQYKNPQDAVDQFNTSVYGGKVNGPGDNGYGKSPAYYPTNNGGGQQSIGMPGYYLVKQADGSWQKTVRQQSAKPNLPAAQSPLSAAAASVAGGVNDASGANVGNSTGLSTTPDLPLMGQGTPNPLQTAINQRLQGMQKAI